MTMAQPQRSKGFMGWLGRQVGYVKQAIETDVTAAKKIVYRSTDVQEQAHPAQPNVTLRRTTIDEVIVITDPEGGHPRPPLTGH